MAHLNKIAVTSPSRQHPSELETSIASALYDLETNIPDMKSALRPLQFVNAKEVCEESPSPTSWQAGKVLYRGIKLLMLGFHPFHSSKSGMAGRQLSSSSPFLFYKVSIKSSNGKFYLIPSSINQSIDRTNKPHNLLVQIQIQPQLPIPPCPSNNLRKGII